MLTLKIRAELNGVRVVLRRYICLLSKWSREIKPLEDAWGFDPTEQLPKSALVQNAEESTRHAAEGSHYRMEKMRTTEA